MLTYEQVSEANAVRDKLLHADVTTLFKFLRDEITSEVDAAPDSKEAEAISCALRIARTLITDFHDIANAARIQAAGNPHRHHSLAAS